MPQKFPIKVKWLLAKSKAFSLTKINTWAGSTVYAFFTRLRINSQEAGVRGTSGTGGPASPRKSPRARRACGWEGGRVSMGSGLGDPVTPFGDRREGGGHSERGGGARGASLLSALALAPSCHCRSPPGPAGGQVCEAAGRCPHRACGHISWYHWPLCCLPV